MLILHLRGDSFFSNKQFLNDSILWRNNQVRHSKHFYQHFFNVPGFNNFMLTTPKKLFYFFRDMPRKCVSFKLKKKSPDCLYFRHSTSPQLPNIYFVALWDRTCGPPRVEPPTLLWLSPRGTTRYVTTTTTQILVNPTRLADTILR